MSSYYNGNVCLKNFLIDSYLYHYKYRISHPITFIVIQYILVASFLVNICREFLCMFIIDYNTRLYLFDIALFFGGVRQYHNFVDIIVYSLGLYMFVKLHMTRNESVMKWTQLLRVLRGDCRPSTMTLFKFNMHKFDHFVKFSKILYKMSKIIYLTTCKYILGFNKYFNRTLIYLFSYFRTSSGNASNLAFFRHQVIVDSIAIIDVNSGIAHYIPLRSLDCRSVTSADHPFRTLIPGQHQYQDNR